MARCRHGIDQGKRPGYWEVRVFVGYDDAGKPVQVSKAIRGGKRDAQRLAAQLAWRPQARSGSLAIAGLLDDYLDFKGPAWAVTPNVTSGPGPKASIGKCPRTS